ncbi:MAG: hypothetical protein ACM3ZC_15170 [Bacteroidota bacterium]
MPTKLAAIGDSLTLDRLAQVIRIGLPTLSVRRSEHACLEILPPGETRRTALTSLRILLGIGTKQGMKRPRMGDGRRIYCRET